MRSRKVYKQSARHANKKVSNVKSYPVPELEGEAAKDFEKKIYAPYQGTNAKK